MAITYNLFSLLEATQTKLSLWLLTRYYRRTHAPLFSPSLCFRWGKGRPSKLLSSLFTSQFLQVLSATTSKVFHVSLFTRQVIYIVTTRIYLGQNKLPWIYYCLAHCPNTEWYFLQTCCFYKLTPAGKMIFRVQFGIREYPAIQVFTFMLIISTSQGPQQISREWKRLGASSQTSHSEPGETNGF